MVQGAQTLEGIVQTTLQEHVQNRLAGQIMDILMPRLTKKIGDNVQSRTQERVHIRTAEQTVAVNDSDNSDKSHKIHEGNATNVAGNNDEANDTSDASDRGGKGNATIGKSSRVDENHETDRNS